MAVLDELQEAVAGAAAATAPSVVGLGRGWRAGSGVVLAEGLVLTTAHGRRGDAVTVTFDDGRQASATLAAADLDGDLAVLRVDTQDAPPIAWGDPAAAGLGTPVVALANPAGRGLRATLGLVSGTGRSFRGPRGRRITGTLEHTAPLPRGSSGGPLVDREGRLLGLNALRLDGGFILALAADAGLRARAEALGRGEAPAGVSLGVAVVPPRAARRLRRAVGLPERDGLLVRQVVDDGPAAAAGVQPGDLIVSAAGRTLDSVDALYGVLDELAPGDAVTLGLVRGVEERELELRPGAAR